MRAISFRLYYCTSIETVDINIAIDALWRKYWSNGANYIDISACHSLRNNHALLNSLSL